MPVFPTVRLAVAGVVPAALLLAGCGSASTPAAGHPAVPADNVCTRIADVLGNGPDPAADPVGYAEAQIGPLAAVHSSRPGVQAAITRLDAAFRREFAHGATAATKAAVKAGRRGVNAVCPGAAS